MDSIARYVSYASYSVATHLEPAGVLARTLLIVDDSYTSVGQLKTWLTTHITQCSQSLHAIHWHRYPSAQDVEALRLYLRQRHCSSICLLMADVPEPILAACYREARHVLVFSPSLTTQKLQAMAKSIRTVSGLLVLGDAKDTLDIEGIEPQRLCLHNCTITGDYSQCTRYSLIKCSLDPLRDYVLDGVVESIESCTFRSKANTIPSLVELCVAMVGVQPYMKERAVERRMCFKCTKLDCYAVYTYHWITARCLVSSTKCSTCLKL